jgi:hypothetical protein
MSTLCSRELLVKAILDSRPTLIVRSAYLKEIAAAISDFARHVVVCSEPNGDHPAAGSGAWVQVPTDDPAEDHARLARMCLDGEHWSTEGPSLSELLAVIDEARERLRQGTLSSDC